MIKVKVKAKAKTKEKIKKWTSFQKAQVIPFRLMSLTKFLTNWKDLSKKED